MVRDRDRDRTPFGLVRALLPGLAVLGAWSLDAPLPPLDADQGPWLYGRATVSDGAGDPVSRARVGFSFRADPNSACAGASGVESSLTEPGGEFEPALRSFGGGGPACLRVDVIPPAGSGLADQRVLDGVRVTLRGPGDPLPRDTVTVNVVLQPEP